MWFKRSKDLKTRSLKMKVERGADAVIRPDLVRKAIAKINKSKDRKID